MKQKIPAILAGKRIKIMPQSLWQSFCTIVHVLILLTINYLYYEQKR